MAKLPEEIKVRVSKETKSALVAIAEQEGEGVAISDVARRAIGDFLRRHAAVKEDAAQGTSAAKTAALSLVERALNRSQSQSADSPQNRPEKHPSKRPRKRAR